MIASTFSPDIRHASGWSKDVIATAPRLREAFETRYALALPILGIALGAGVAWCLITILGDRTEKWAGDQQAIRTPAGAWQSIKTISGRAFSLAWRNVIAMSLGGLAAWAVLQPGVYVAASLPPVGWRTAGIALVVLFGSIFCEIGFLFGVLSVRVGASMGEYPDFLSPGQVR
jgi:hypothetical protein